MALIKCPECGKEVSDKASACIHCGFPFDDLKNDKMKSCTELFTYQSNLAFAIPPEKVTLLCEKCKKPITLSQTDFAEINPEAFVIVKKNIKCNSCNNELQSFTKIPSMLYREGGQEKVNQWIYSVNKHVEERKSYMPTSSLPTCPRCGATSITTGPRGVNGFWGFIGASKTVNRCANCGHMWQPKG